MKVTLWLVMRELRHNQRRVMLLSLTVALAEAGLYVILSLSFGYWRYFLEQAALAGKDALPLAWQGIIDVGKMLSALMFQLFLRMVPLDVLAEDILSGEAALKNLPAFILLSGMTALIAVRCAVGLLFSVYRRQHRHFLTSLLVGGADDDFLRRFVSTETLCLWAFALPVAVLLGVAQSAALKHSMSVFFCRFGTQTPVAVRGNLLYALAAGLIVLWMALRGAGKSVRGLSVKNAARELRRQTGALLGIRALTSEPLLYRFLGLPHYIAMRNIEDRLGRYIRIIFMTTVYHSVIGCILLLLTVVRNSAVKESAVIPGGEAFFSANEFFFCASAAVTQVIATVGTICGMISNITSNVTEYAQLRTAGASMYMIRRCARREGILSVFVGLWIGLFWMVMFFSVFTGVYGPSMSEAVDLSGAGKSLLVLCAVTLVHMAAVFAAVCVACWRVNRIDLLREMKELAYS